MKLIPKINGSLEMGNGTLQLSPEIRLPRQYPEIDQVFDQRLTALELPPAQGKPTQVVVHTEAMGNGAYRLKIGEDTIRVDAAGPEGYSNALTTLYQLAVMGRGKVLCCTLTDSPRFGWRGVMLDVCRHFFPVEEIKRILEQCALLKLNRFHWHLSNDQGFRVESRRFPELNQISSCRLLSPDDPLVEREAAKAGDRYGGYYTQEEIREVVAYAQARQIEVIPELEVPGHSSAILAAFPQFTCSGEPLRVKNTFGVHERIFCAGNEAAYDFLFELLDEWFELFPSKFIHLGGDEAPKTVWRACPKCRQVIEREGLGGYEALQAYFTGRLTEYCKKAGKIPIVWNESAASGTLSDDAVVQYWAEMAPGPSYVAPELSRGRKLILSNGDNLYCSNNYAEMPLRATLCYEPNVKGIPVPKENVLGVEAAMWTEWTPEPGDIEEHMYPRLLAVAECGWSRERSWEEFEPRAQDFLETGSLNVLRPFPWTQATVHGERALQMIARGMLEMGRKYGSMSSGDPEEASGKAEAVTPDGTEAQQVDMRSAVRAHMEGKLNGIYTPEEIERVIQIILDEMERET